MTEGQKYGKLTAIQRVEHKNKQQAYWQFQCLCGNITVTRATMVKNGQTRSCGCLRKESWRKKC